MGFTDCRLLSHNHYLASCEVTNRVERLISKYSIQIIECSHNVCICKPNSLIAYASWVTFYHCSGNYEHVIAYGNVETITQSGAMQIKVFAIDSEDQNILEYINNEKENILIRPALTTEAINQITNYI